MKRILLSAISSFAVLLVFCSIVPALSEADYSAEGWYCVNTITPEDYDYSYLYSKPSSSKGKNLERVDDNEYVYVYYTTSGTGAKESVWAYCDYNGTEGYIRFENLDSIAEYGYDSHQDYNSDNDDDTWEWADVDPMSCMYMIVTNCDEWVSLRKWPDTSAPRLSKVPKDGVVWAAPYNDDWYKCVYNGQIGYILSDYLEVNAC